MTLQEPSLSLEAQSATLHAYAFRNAARGCFCERVQSQRQIQDLGCRASVQQHRLRQSRNEPGTRNIGTRNL